MRLGILADIHGNEVALRAVLKDAERLGIHRWWALGDPVLRELRLLLSGRG